MSSVANPAVFRREKKPKVAVTINLSPAVARAIKKHHRRHTSWKSLSLMVEAMIVQHLEAPRLLQSFGVEAFLYEPSENHVARKIRRQYWRKAAARWTVQTVDNTAALNGR